MAGELPVAATACAVQSMTAPQSRQIRRVERTGVRSFFISTPFHGYMEKEAFASWVKLLKKTENLEHYVIFKIYSVLNKIINGKCDGSDQTGGRKTDLLVRKRLKVPIISCLVQG